MRYIKNNISPLNEERLLKDAKETGTAIVYLGERWEEPEKVFDIKREETVCKMNENVEEVSFYPWMVELEFE